MAHHKSLVRYAQRLRAARPCDAEDLVQDTIVKALTKQDRFQPGTDLGAWLRTMMHHLNADQARKREARFAHIPIPDDRDRSEGFEDVEQFVALSVPPAQERGDVMAALGWAVGDTIVVGYGEPGTADFGAVRLLRTKPSKRPRTGVKLRRSSKPGTSSGQLHISFRCEWISEDKHSATICPWTRACDGADALDVRLPKWAILPAPAALREVAALVARHVAERSPDNHNPESPADPPPAVEARQATADPLSTAQAGGSDSAGDSAAPPAVNPGSGETSCPQREAASEGMAEQQRDTMGVTAGRGRHLEQRSTAALGSLSSETCAEEGRGRGEDCGSPARETGTTGGSDSPAPAKSQTESRLSGEAPAASDAGSKQAGESPAAVSSDDSVAIRPQWTGEQDAELKTLRASGLTWEDIAALLMPASRRSEPCVSGTR